VTRIVWLAGEYGRYGYRRSTATWKASFVVLRDELLAREAFDTLLDAKVLIEHWRQHYNTNRPHSALG